MQSDSFNPDRPGWSTSCLRARWSRCGTRFADEMHFFAGVPHSSFPHPTSSATDLPRESIEVRALVYFEDDATGAI